MSKLYIVSTPIGNLEDITIRAIKVLRESHLVAAEDTRTASKLFDRYAISSKLTSYHSHNKERKSTRILDQVDSGKDVSLISESGTPCISDPGNLLVRKAQTRKIDIAIIPGPTAFVPALIYSGFKINRFIYEGFTPSSGTNRRRRLRNIKDEERTVVFYESPHRLVDFLEDVDKILEGRPVAVVREMTKVFQEVKHGSPAELIEYFKNKEVKGEITVVIEGKREEENGKEEMIKQLKI